MDPQRSSKTLAANCQRVLGALSLRLWVGVLHLLFGFLSPLNAAPLIDDPFTDGNRSNASGGDLQGAVWFHSGSTPTPVSVVDDGAGIGSGKALQLVPSGDFHKILAFFPSTTLAATGDALIATFDYRFPTAPASLGGGFRIGLCNSAGTKQTADGAGGPRTDDKNYGFDTNPGLTGSTGTGVRYENAGDDILGGSGLGVRSSFGTSGGAIASDTVKHSALLQITRIGDDLHVQAQVDNLSIASGTHAAALTYTFDEFAFGFGGTGYRPTIIVDNVEVSSTTTTVLNIAATDATASKAGPEPANFTVTRSSSSGALNVPYSLSGTAANGVDYEALSGSVAFADGQSTATITVSPIPEFFVDSSKTVTVTLSAPPGALLQTSAATATITESFAATTGQIEPEFSELYTFYLSAAEGARLWIDDRLLVARTFPQSGDIRGQIRLTAGQRVNYRVESIGTMALEWSSPSRTRQVIPPSRMFPTRVDRAGGSILREHWSTLPGTSIAALTSNANYPNQPSGRELFTSFECLAQNWADNYGTRVTGYIIPPATGEYTFAVSGDDAVELRLSTDSTEANKTLIASVSSATAFRQWNGQASQQSALISLVQGQRYYVELLHKEDSGSDHWSVGWMKPGDATFSVIPGSALVQAGLDRAQPGQASLLDTLALEHPRLMATRERFAWLRTLWQSATTSLPKTWAQSAITSANTILGQPPVIYAEDDRGTILDQARTVKDRIYKLGLAWWLTGDNAYAERAWIELNTVADNTLFPDWDPDHFLDTAELSHACAIGYDWFYDYWTETRRETIRTAIISKGLNAGLTEYTNNVGWSRSTGNNWNEVCNGGLALGALALGTESESIVEDILNRALNSVRPAMGHFTTDNGGWYEGPGYWGYTTEYNTRMLAGLESALGSDFGLSGTRLLSEAGFYPMAMTGPGGLAFNHADAGSSRVKENALEWQARRFNQPLFAWYENAYGSGVLDALWWNDQPMSSPAAAALSPDFAFHGESGTAFKPLEAVTLRGNWTDARASFVGCKGGHMGADHGNLDAGTFVLDALGKRWFLELGGDDYGLPGYFSSTPNSIGDDRWDYYRNRGEGQNTIVVDPGPGPDMSYNTVAPLIGYQSEPGGRRSMAVYALTPVTPGVTRLWRGFQLMGNRNQLLVQDEISASSGRTVWWFAHYNQTNTTVVIDPDGTAATLTQGAERLWVKIVSGPGASFQTLDAVPLPTSPNPAVQNANTSFKKLTIQLTNITSTTLAVWMVPLSPGENPPETLPAITPLNSWNLAATDDPPVARNANITTDADNAVDIDLRNQASDDASYSDHLTYAVSGSINGSVILLADGHTARFTPVAGYTGIPSFSYLASDAVGQSAAGAITVSAAAGTHVWTATTSGVWSGGGNWSAGTPPVSSRGNTIEFFTGQTLSTASLTANNDNGLLQANVLTLNGTAGAIAAVTVSGGSLSLTNNGALNPVVNLSAITGSGLSYDVNNALTLAVPTTFQGGGSAAFRFNGNITGDGSLTKAGSSTLILTGTNSYTGGTTISGGTLQVGNNTATGTLPAGSLTNNATLRFHRSDTALIVPNAIIGTGGLQFGVSTGGTIGAITTLTGPNTFAANVSISSGAVRITHSSALGAGTKTITLTNGTNGQPGLRLDGTAGAIVLPSTFSFITSSGTATNPALINEAGDNVIGGNFTLSSGGGDTRFRSDAGSLTLLGDLTLTASTRNLILAGTASGTINGSISEAPPNVLSLRKEDAGTWTLNGSLSHTGSITIKAGTLMVNGSITAASSLSVDASAKLSGSGTISANTTVVGAHQPGAGIGPQTFTGSLSYGNASHLGWELVANVDTGEGTHFDKVNATTVAITTNAVIDVTLNPPGSTVNFANAFWAQSHTWTVVNASTSLTGTFKMGTVTADSAGQSVTGFGAFSLQHTTTAVNLVWTPAPPSQQWQAKWFGANWTYATLAGDTADPDKDGRRNLVERAIGANPNSPDPAADPVVSRVSGRLSLNFKRDPANTDLTLTVRGADAVGGWIDLARSTAGGAFVPLVTGVTVTESGSDSTRTVQIIDPYTIGDTAHPRRFLDLQVQH